VINPIVDFIISVLVYPGMIFTFIIALLTQWYYRKAYARMQNRVGPRFVGPRGILQPLADFLKLLTKEDITTIVAREKAPILFLSLGIGAIITILLMLPFSIFPIRAPYDIMLCIYLALWATLALALLGLLTPNPFSIVGASRLLSLVFVYEPLFVASLLVPVILASRLYNASYSIYLTSLYSWRLWWEPLAVIPLALGLFSIILTLQCKLMLKPFDIPEAETEIVAGFFTEYSGPKLAYIITLHDVEMVVYTFLIVFLFLGGPAPFPLYSIGGVLTIAIKYLVVVTILTLIKAATARYRIEQALSFMWKYVAPPAIIAVVLAVILPI